MTQSSLTAEQIRLSLLINQLKNKIELGKMKDLAELAMKLSLNKNPSVIAQELSRRLKLKPEDQRALEVIFRGLQ